MKSAPFSPVVPSLLLCARETIEIRDEWRLNAAAAATDSSSSSSSYSCSLAAVCINNRTHTWEYEAKTVCDGKRAIHTLIFTGFHDSTLKSSLQPHYIAASDVGFIFG